MRAVQVEGPIQLQRFGTSCVPWRRKLSQGWGLMVYLVLLRQVFVLLFIVTYYYLCNTCIIIVYITKCNDENKIVQEMNLLSFGMIGQYLQAFVCVCLFCIIVDWFTKSAAVCSFLEWTSEFFLLRFCTCFCPTLAAFFDSLDLPCEITVVHLWPAAELLYRVFLRADAQPFVCLPPSFHCTFCLSGVEINPTSKRAVEFSQW